MRKMGWKTGEGLGRNREGTVEPIIIDFKVDRKGMKQQNSSQLNISSRNTHTHFYGFINNDDFLFVSGLVAEGEKPQKQTGGLVVTKDLMGKMHSHVTSLTDHLT